MAVGLCPLGGDLVADHVVHERSADGRSCGSAPTRIAMCLAEQSGAFMYHTDPRRFARLMLMPVVWSMLITMRFVARALRAVAHG